MGTVFISSETRVASIEGPKYCAMEAEAAWMTSPVVSSRGQFRTVAPYFATTATLYELVWMLWAFFYNRRD